MVLYDDIYDVKNETFHFLLFVFNIILINATSLVVFAYWVAGANKFDEAPWLMFFNHSWTMFGAPFEMLLSCNSEYMTITHYYKYFLFFHFSWCFGLLPYLHFFGTDPYGLPISFKEKPLGCFFIVLVSSFMISMIHRIYLRFFDNVNQVIKKKKKHE